MEPVLNVNNEVVRMRKVVKDVKILTIRKIGRIIAKLRKGTKEQIEENQGRIKAFIEEIETIKKMKADDVVKSALEEDFRFDEVFNQENSVTEMEIVARLASNPLMKSKISAMRDAVKAFKEARKNPSEEVGEKEKSCTAPALTKSPSIRVVDKSRQEKAKQEWSAKPVQAAEAKTRESFSKTKVAKQTCEKKAIAKKSEKKAPAAHGSDSSDIEDSDKEDKEYFDDSTEERFHKQPSDFDTESDSEDDFFIGKVRQTKKKKSNNPDSKVKKDKSPPESTNSTAVRTEEQKWKPATKKLESVFCQTLSSSSTNSHPKSSKVNRTVVSNPHRYKESQAAPNMNDRRPGYSDGKLPPFRNNKYAAPQAKTFTRNPYPVRGGATKQPIKRQHQEVLHPSWEASKKRKEQSQIAVFQGKKITFDN